MKFKVIVVVAARPNMMKVAPILAEMAKRPDFEPLLIHTGQHYDYSMSQVFFNELQMPEPVRNLGVGGGTHHEQTGEVIKQFGELVREIKPHCVVVVGDVNATVACSLVAAKEHIPLVHVESGLRSFDREMPEEINRLVTDVLADLLLVSEDSGWENLQREGIPDDRVVMTGNVMIDSLVNMLPAARNSNILDHLKLRGRKYILLTLHRPSNVDAPEQFSQTLKAIAEIGTEIPILFPVHPRTAARMREIGFNDFQSADESGVGKNGLWIIPPASYRDFVSLMESCSLVITDSGGIQEETTYLGVPCITYRENTERPVTVQLGTNRVIGSDPTRLLREAKSVMNGRTSEHQIPPLWDGKASARIVDAIESLLRERTKE